MGFRCKMDDATYVIFVEDELNQFPVANISPDEPVSWILFTFFEVFQIACIGQ